MTQKFKISIGMAARRAVLRIGRGLDDWVNKGNSTRLQMVKTPPGLAAAASLCVRFMHPSAADDDDFKSAGNHRRPRAWIFGGCSGWRSEVGGNEVDAVI